MIRTRRTTSVLLLLVFGAGVFISTLHLREVFVGDGLQLGFALATVLPLAIGALLSFTPLPWFAKALAQAAALHLFLSFTALSSSLTSGVPLLDSLTATWEGVTLGWAELLSTPAPMTPGGLVFVPPLAVIWAMAALGAGAIFRRTPTALEIPPLVAGWLMLLFLGPGAAPDRITTIALVVICAVLLLFRSFGDASAIENDEVPLATGGPGGSATRVFSTVFAQAIPFIGMALALAIIVGLNASFLDDTERSDPRSQWVPDFEFTEQVSPLSLVRPQLQLDEPEPIMTIEVNPPLETSNDVLRIRTAALNQFDGALWRHGNEFAVVGSRIEPPESTGFETTMTISLAPSTAVGTYLPLAGSPASIDGVQAAVESDTLTAVQTRESDETLTYQTSTVLQPELIDLVGQDTALGQSPAFLPELPQDLAQLLDGFASTNGLEDASTSGGSTVQTLVDLQASLEDESFGFDTSVVSGHGFVSISRYLGTSEILNARLGSAEQSASTAAVLGRQLGFPTRVAVGYRVEAEEGATTYDVDTSQAHAWAEVHLDGIGWVAIDPVVDEQREAEVPDRASTIQVTAASGTPPPEFGEPLADEQGERSGLPLVLIGVAIAIFILSLLLIPLIKLLKRRRRRSAATTAATRVLSAWDDVIEAVVDLGLKVGPEFTARDTSHAAQETALITESAGLDTLAAYASAAKWAPEALGPIDVETATGISDHALSSLKSQGVRSRLRRLYSTRSLRGSSAANRGPLTAGSRWDRFDMMREEDHEKWIVDMREPEPVVLEEPANLPEEPAGFENDVLSPM